MVSRTDLVLVVKNTFLHAVEPGTGKRLRRSRSCPLLPGGPASEGVPAADLRRCPTALRRALDGRTKAARVAGFDSTKAAASPEVKRAPPCATPAKSVAAARDVLRPGTCRGGEVVTLTMKNLPSRLLPEQLRAFLAERGYHGAIEHFNMPMRQEGGLNRGYAFVTLNDPEVAKNFLRELHHCVLPGRESTKEMIVEPAKIQGLERTLEHLRKKERQRRDRGRTCGQAMILVQGKTSKVC